jgi:hypothetical protein
MYRRNQSTSQFYDTEANTTRQAQHRRIFCRPEGVPLVVFNRGRGVVSSPKQLPYHASSSQARPSRRHRVLAVYRHICFACSRWDTYHDNNINFHHDDLYGSSMVLEGAFADLSRLWKPYSGCLVGVMICERIYRVSIAREAS